MRFSRFITPLIFILSASFCSAACAEIYRYKDKNGRWQFSDKPVNSGKNQSVTLNAKPKSQKRDLKELLVKKFNPQSKVDEASLAVVMIETSTGSGSGFFVTDDGFIITNRHVVRPSTTNRWKENEVKLDEQKVELKELSLELKNERERLKDMQAVIDEDKEYMNSSRARKEERTRYERYISRHARDKKRLEKEEKKYKKKEREYNEKKSEFGWKSSISNFARKFSITLKNGKKLKAKLIKVSKDHDLAMLKLENFATPFIPVSTGKSVRQGDKVFAIGSPLGITDSLTSGIITKLDKDHLVTDTRILPGNSGGPLIDETGQVIGVNTAVVSENEHADGLGLAVYSKLIRIEFNDKLAGRI